MGFDMDKSRLTKILDASPDTYLVIDENGVLVDFKPGQHFKPVLLSDGKPGKPIIEVLPGPLAEPGLLRVKEVLETGEEKVIDFNLPVDGSPRHYEARFTPFDDNQVLAIIRDMTEWACSIQTIQVLLDASKDLTLLLDRQGHIISINKKAADIFGKTIEQMEGTLFWDHQVQERVPLPRERMEGVFQTGEPAELVHLSDEKILEAFLYPVFETPGEVRYVAYFVRDISRQVEAEQKLIESGARHRLLFEDNPVPMYIYDTKTLGIIDANKAFIDSYGYSLEELISMTISDIRPPEDVSRVMENLSDLRSRQVHLGVWRHTKKDGTIIDVEITSGDFPLENRPARLVICSDVTEKVRLWKALRESEEKFRKAFFTSPDPMIISRIEDGVLLEINEGFVKSTGYSREESLGKSSFDLNLWAVDGQRDELVGRLDQYGELVNFKASIRRKDGSIGTALISASKINIGEVPRMLTVSRDITELKKTEDALVQSEEQLRISLREKEMLLKEIHHRVKNNLQVISGLLDLQAHHIGDPTVREVYKESQNRVITMALIHEELYKSTNLTQVNFAEYIQNLCENLMISYGADKDRIKLDINTEKMEMVVDTAIPCGLIINELITNSLKHAFPDGRRGKISLFFRQLEDNSYVLTVSDNGIGMSDEIDVGSTTTLGMQLVTVLVGQLGGTLNIDRDGGTSFTIKFREYCEAGSILY